MAAQAQRIDYSLNHLPGLLILNATKARFVQGDNIAVAYQAINTQSDTDNYICLMTSTGKILSNHKLFSNSLGQVKDFDVFNAGYMMLVEKSERSFYKLNSAWFDSTFNLIDSLNICQFNPTYVHKPLVTFKQSCLAILSHTEDAGFSVAIGKFNHQIHRINWMHQDTFKLFSHGFNFKWITGASQPTLLAKYGDTTRVFLFDFTLSLLKDSIIDEKNGFDLAYLNDRTILYLPFVKLQDTLYDGVIKSNKRDTFFKFKSDGFKLRNNDFQIYSSGSHLFTLRSFTYFVNDSVWVDSIGVLAFDSTTSLLFEANIPSMDYKSIDATNDLMVLMGRANDWDESVAIYTFRKSGMITGIMKIMNTKEIIVYPNPVTKTLNFSDVGFQAQLKLFNTKSQVVLSTTQTQNIDVSHLPSGLYFYKITNVQQQVVAQGKIIKL
jgi:hypothetical protein